MSVRSVHTRKDGHFLSITQAEAVLCRPLHPGVVLKGIEIAGFLKVTIV
jgi:hypothetical protein